MSIIIESKVIKTSYGVGMKDKQQSSESILSIIENHGDFSIKISQNNEAFYIVVEK